MLVDIRLAVAGLIYRQIAPVPQRARAAAGVLAAEFRTHARVDAVVLVVPTAVVEADAAVELLFAVRPVQRRAVVHVAGCGLHVLQELVTRVQVSAVKLLVWTRVALEALLVEAGERRVRVGRRVVDRAAVERHWVVERSVVVETVHYRRPR